MAAVHVRRRRTATLVLVASLAGLGGLLALVALVASASSDDRAPVAAPPASVAKAVAEPPPDPLAPRSVRATGKLATVPPEGQPDGDPPGIGFAVEVEEGVELDRAAFARTVERTLLDRRGWTGDGSYSLRRSAAAEEPGFRVTVASPQTTDELCAPLQTKGIYSCHQNGRAVLNAARWARGAAAFGPDLAGYRRYMVNHEVGHALGRGHLDCPGQGQRAPVMMQQTKGVGFCAPNPWPLASER